jgi:hypothetical protein
MIIDAHYFSTQEVNKKINCVCVLIQYIALAVLEVTTPEYELHLCRMASSGMSPRVALVRTDVSEEVLDLILTISIS